jgi:DNA-binding response OmpR family regulator
LPIILKLHILLEQRGVDMVHEGRRAIVLDHDLQRRCRLELTVVRCGYGVLSYSSPAETPMIKEPEMYPSVTGDSASFGENANCAELIITNMRMPFYSGLDYVRKRRQLGCKVRHIALMSGDLTRDERLEAEALGCTVFVKPFDTAEMKAWILSLEY